MQDGADKIESTRNAMTLPLACKQTAVQQVLLQMSAPQHTCHRTGGLHALRRA